MVRKPWRWPTPPVRPPTRSSASKPSSRPSKPMPPLLVWRLTRCPGAWSMIPGGPQLPASDAPKCLEDMLVPPEAREPTGAPSEILAGGTTDPAQPENLGDALTDVAGQPVPTSPSAADRILDELTGQ